MMPQTCLSARIREVTCPTGLTRLSVVLLIGASAAFQASPVVSADTKTQNRPAITHGALVHAPAGRQVVAADPKSTGDVNAGGAIEGVVRAASDSTPLQSVGVYLYTGTQQSLIGYAGTDYTDSNGKYSFSGLNAGAYYLRIDPLSAGNYLEQFYNNKSSLKQADAINVTAGVTTTVNVDLNSGGTLGGRVTGSDGNLPLSHVHVWLYGPRNVSADVCGWALRGYRGSELTDANGVYTFTQLATGNYYVGFYPLTNTPYLPEYFNDQTSLSNATPISLAAGSTNTFVDAILQRSGAITGRVVADDSGLGLVNVDVDAYTKIGSYYSHQSYGRTDANGYFTVTQLAGGQYFLSIAPSGYGDSPSNIYAREAYNDKPNLTQADPIVVTLGATTSDIQIGLARGAQIKGRVTAGDTGDPLAHVSIFLDDAAGNGSNQHYSGQTDANGVYTTTGLATGTYRVRFFPTYSGPPANDYLPEYYNKKPNPATADTISVIAPGIRENVDAQLSRGGVITGFVSITTGVFSSVPVVAYLNPYSYSEKTAITNATNGYYEIRGLPNGDYKVKFGPYTQMVFDENCAATSTEYAAVWFDQKPTRETATVVQVSAPNVVPNINGTLGAGTVVTPKKYVYLPVVMR